jgi:8-oxo-dGTP diphosphatase
MFWYPKEADLDARDAGGVTLREFLEKYDPKRYELPAVTVDILAFRLEEDGMSLLLIRRGRHPAYGMLALPGGFVEMNESLEEAAARELLEETGLSDVELTQLGAYGDVGRDPRMRIVSVAYMSVLRRDMPVRAGDDAADAAFYRVSVGQKRQNMEDIYDLSFISEKGRASAKIVKSLGKRVIAESGIASDHSIMILDALERLGLVENK